MQEPVQNARRGRRASKRPCIEQVRYSEQKSLYRKQKRQESEQAAVHASEVQRAEGPVQKAEEAGERASGRALSK
jgi:hypothetical protein